MIKRILIQLILVLSIVAVKAGASEKPIGSDVVCSDVANCRELQKKIDARLRELLYKAPLLGELERHTDGTMKQMTHREAIRFCAQKGVGWHLPKPVEWAMILQGMGAEGIRETDYPEVPTSNSKVELERYYLHKAGYEQLLKTDEKGQTVVDFYYSYQSYSKPITGDFSGFHYFASAEDPTLPGFAYVMHGHDGTFGNLNATIKNSYTAVRCVQAQ